jgi:subtilisin family serine protease
MGRCRKILFLFILFPGLLFGQANRYVVFFKDKTNTPFSVRQPSSFLSGKAINRRAKQNKGIVENDLPVDPAYVARVKNSGARTFFTSRWMNGVLVEIGADSVNTLRSLPFVSNVELVAPGKKLSGGRVGKLKNQSSAAAASATLAQLQQVGLDEMQGRNIHGEGISIAILDGGFQGVNSATPFQRLFQNGQVKLTVDFVGNTGNVYQYDEHGTEVLSVIGGTIPNTFTGGAFAANFYLFVTEDVSSEYRIEEYNWLFAAEKADSAGVDIISTSLGYNEFDDPSMNYSPANLDGKTAIITRAAVQAMLKGMVVVCSAGNEGNQPWHYITAPADAKGILACGAVNSDGVRVPFSSVGPTADGRIKPDVVALGSGDAVILATGSIGYRNGTSFACPLIASLAAGVWQADSLLTAEEVVDAIIKSADQAHTPDNLKGYGLPNFLGVKNYLARTQMDDAVMIYPNPGSNAPLHVLFKEPTNEPLTVTIYDRLGRTLSESTVDVTWRNNPVQINVDGMTSGLYLIKVKGPSLVKTFRWIKV